MLTLIWLY